MLSRGSERADTEPVKVWGRSRDNSAGETVAGLVKRLSQLREDETIYAREPWTPDSPALLHVQDVERGGDMVVGDFKYFLEVDIARDVVEVCEEWRRAEGLKTTGRDRVAAVIHYAAHDAYLPVHPEPPLPFAAVDGMELQVLWFDKDGPGGAARLTAPDGAIAQVVWDSGPTHSQHRAVHAPGGRSWGLYGVGRPLPMTTDTEAVAFLASFADEAHSAWRAWRDDDNGD